MRENRFRGWDKEHNRMFNVVELSYEDDKTLAWRKPYKNEPVSWLTSGLEVGIECYLMQFTGLYDEDGKEIYIGDVVALKGETSEGFYRVDHFEVVINDFMQIPVIDSERGQENLYKVHNICRVIGNVFDMPDWDC